MKLLEIEKEALKRAIHIASFGLYTTTPNPRVGAVLIAKNKIIAEGYHYKAGSAHAEINAINQAHSNGHSLQGGTIVVSLEPCCHFNRTPPCTDAIINAGISRVIIANLDPNPKVAGGGAAKLKSAGINVIFTDDQIASSAEKLNIGFFHRQKTNRPIINLKIALFNNGCSALPNNNKQSQWISNEECRADVQYWRARSCAIITGVNTVLIDNPQLNVRNPPALFYKQNINNIRQPIKIVLGSSNKLSHYPKLNIFKQGEVLQIVNCSSGESVKKNIENQLNLEQVNLALYSNIHNKINLQALLDVLAKKQFNEVMLECGAKLANAFLNEGLVSQLTLYYAKAQNPNAINPVEGLAKDKILNNPNWQIESIKNFSGDERVVLIKHGST